MDHPENTQAQPHAFPASQFPPPPVAFGGDQHQKIPLADLNIHANNEDEDLYNAPADANPPTRQQNFQAQSIATQEQPPSLPQRHPEHRVQPAPLAPYDPASYAANTAPKAFPPPPQRHREHFGNEDPTDPIHDIRDPHKLTAYLVPFPKPQLKKADQNAVPTRFLIYTPPPPPLAKPAEGDKEGKLHKVQRKWQEEVRNAKTTTAKTASWQGMKSKVTRGVSKGMNYTTTSNLDFLGRVSSPNSKSDSSEDDGQGHSGATSTKATVPLSEIVLIYPPTFTLSPEEMRTEFINTMLRTKSKATRDSIIATGLLPITFGIDILATPVWPFGGLGEIDTVWAYNNIRGAKTARSVTKRLLSSSASTNDPDARVDPDLKGPADIKADAPNKAVVDPKADGDTLHLTFTASARVDLLQRYLTAECHKVDSTLFPGYSSPPLEVDVLEAIGWSPRQTDEENRNWEDELWEQAEVKEDLRKVMHKAAKEWRQWCTLYEKNPEKAMKK